MKAGQNVGRTVVLGIIVVLEGLVLLSVVLHVDLLPFALFDTIYPNIVSLLIIVLPLVIGILTPRWEWAVVLAVLPFLVLAIIYSTVYAPVWQIDLFQLGLLAQRVAGMLFLLGGLSFAGWLGRRAVGLPTTTTSVKMP
jgi:hypothetical protein